MRTIVDAQLGGWTDLVIRCACGAENTRPLEAFYPHRADGDLKLITERLRCRACGQPPQTIQLHRQVVGIDGRRPFRRPLLPMLDGTSP